MRDERVTTFQYAVEKRTVWLYKRFYDEQRFQAVEQRRNVLVADGTSTGKTTLVNALLAEVAKTSDRVILIEDTRELHCQAPNSRCLAYIRQLVV